MDVGIRGVRKEFDRFAALHDVASLLAMITLIVKSILEWRSGDELASARRQGSE